MDHIVSAARRQKVINACCQLLLLSLFNLVWAPSPCGMAQPRMKVGLSTSSNLVHLSQTAPEASLIGNRLGKAGRIRIGVLRLLFSCEVQACTLHPQGRLGHRESHFSRLSGRAIKGNPQVLSTGGELRAHSGWTLWLEAWALR